MTIRLSSFSLTLPLWLAIFIAAVFALAVLVYVLDVILDWWLNGNSKDLKDLETSTAALSAAVQRNQPRDAASVPRNGSHTQAAERDTSMNPNIQPMHDAIAAAKTAQESAILLINGIAARIQAAKDQAVANGATEEQLAPFADEIAALNADSTALAAAVVANTPSAPPADGSGAPADASK